MRYVAHYSDANGLEDKRVSIKRKIVQGSGPTITTYGSGSGSGGTAYFPPAGCQWIKVRAVGGGGAGGGTGTGAGAGQSGGNTTFAGMTCYCGTGNSGYTGGSNVSGVNGASVAVSGGSGTNGAPIGSQRGADGGVSFFGGNGKGGILSTSTTPEAGGSAIVNTGSGGGSAGMGSGGGSAGGGGAGGYGELIITSLSASYSYSVGAGGAGGTAGTGGAAGGAGGSGIIIIEEYYS